MNAVDADNANTLIRALVADRDEWRTSALNWPSIHLDRGRCPTADQPETRDVSCPGCGRLIATGNALAVALNLPSAVIPPAVDGAHPLPGPVPPEPGRGEHHPGMAT